MTVKITNYQFDWKRLLSHNEEDYRRECLVQMRWNGKITCPHCKNFEKRITECKKNHKYRCNACDKRFTVTSGTHLHSTKLSLLVWFTALKHFSICKSGISSYEMATFLDVSQTTAFRLGRKFRSGMSNAEHFKGTLTGIVESDETYVGGKNHNRHADKKIKGSQGRAAVDKSPVVGFISRDTGKLFVWVMKRNKSGEEKKVSIGPGIRALVKAKIDQDSVFCSDEYKVYNGLDHHFDHHLRVVHGQGNYVNGQAHTNTIEGFWNILKKGLMGVYYGRVHHNNLSRYCREIAFRYVTRHCDKYKRMEEMLGLCLIGRYQKRGLYLC